MTKDGSPIWVKKPAVKDGQLNEKKEIQYGHMYDHASEITHHHDVMIDVGGSDAGME